MSNSDTEFEAAITALDNGIPDAEQYQRLSTLVMEHADAKRLAVMDPFSAAYREAAMAFYLTLRGRAEDGYLAHRDEAAPMPLPDNVWTGLAPWSFRDPHMLGEHLFSWGHIFQLLDLPPGGSVLEYGPGSGQILLMLARMGFRACGVDIDAVALDGIRRQAGALGLDVGLDSAIFGEGFDGEQFDRILFYEAFHHAFDFDALLHRLHARLRPGGRLVLCGEPVVPAPVPAVPYPWGPRLDALSVYCIRRFGWMELGFTHDFLVEAARRAGWRAGLHAFPACGRAQAYVLSQADGEPAAAPAPPAIAAAPAPAPTPELAEIERLRQELAALHGSTSWRVTRPLRAARRLASGVRGLLRG